MGGDGSVEVVLGLERVFLVLVLMTGVKEHDGFGILRILEVYPAKCFKFTENFLRMTFPNAWGLSEDLSESENPKKDLYNENVGGAIGGAIGGPMGGPIGGPIELTERQQEIIDLIDE